MVAKERGRSHPGECTNKTIPPFLVVLPRELRNIFKFRYMAFCIGTPYGYIQHLFPLLLLQCSDSESSESESEVARLREAVVDSFTLLQRR